MPRTQFSVYVLHLLGRERDVFFDAQWASDAFRFYEPFHSPPPPPCFTSSAHTSIVTCTLANHHQNAAGVTLSLHAFLRFLAPGTICVPIQLCSFPSFPFETSCLLAMKYSLIPQATLSSFRTNTPSHLNTHQFYNLSHSRSCSLPAKTSSYWDGDDRLWRS